MAVETLPCSVPPPTLILKGPGVAAEEGAVAEKGAEKRAEKGAGAGVGEGKARG